MALPRLPNGDTAKFEYTVQRTAFGSLRRALQACIEAERALDEAVREFADVMSYKEVQVQFEPSTWEWQKTYMYRADGTYGKAAAELIQRLWPKLEYGSK